MAPAPPETDDREGTQRSRGGGGGAHGFRWCGSVAGGVFALGSAVAAMVVARGRPSSARSGTGTRTGGTGGSEGGPAGSPARRRRKKQDTGRGGGEGR
ncbi:hypothetical protein ZWY2020_020580 [Hordeum vulgare]|nr:hypothetical protein ZWY2020_020580 [Hordeum vulgare]